MESEMLLWLVPKGGRQLHAKPHASNTGRAVCGFEPRLWNLESARETKDGAAPSGFPVCYECQRFVQNRLHRSAVLRERP